MHSSFDSFALHFDSIPVEPKRAGEPSSANEIEDQTAASSPLPAQGFTLIDDADGRFGIDRDTGIITLLHEHLLTSEAGAIHPVQIRVIEPSGASYELKFRLRMTGLIPQIAGAEEFDALANLVCPAPNLKPMRAIALAPAPEAKPEPKPSVWPHLAATKDEAAPFGLLGIAPLPSVDLRTSDLSLSDTPPQAAPASAAWLI